MPLDRVWFCGHQYWHRVSCGPLAVINIGTWYLNRPNWLLADYSVYHRVASQGFPAHNIYDRPAIWAPATVQYCDRVCIWTFLVRHVRYIVTGCIFFCTERFATGSGFRPPAAPPPPVHMKVECPPPRLLNRSQWCLIPEGVWYQEKTPPYMSHLCHPTTPSTAENEDWACLIFENAKLRYGTRGRFFLFFQRTFCPWRMRTWSFYETALIFIYRTVRAIHKGL